MPERHARRAAPDVFDFEGAGDEAREWLDHAYGTSLGLGGQMGTVSHRRQQWAGAAVDHLRIGSAVTFDAVEAMPVLVVVDVLDGRLEYTRERVTDRSRAGDTVLASGWARPFSGAGEGYEVRNTSVTVDVLGEAIREIDPEMSADRLSFSGFVPRSRAAAARWRATVDELSGSVPSAVDAAMQKEASRLLAHTILRTFPHNVGADASSAAHARDRRDGTQSTLRRAQEVIQARSSQDLSLLRLADEVGVTPRALQYAFRRHLGCTPHAYLRQVRLDLVHQALCDGTAPSVSDVASRYGFFNPGRFAADYRQVFGHNPGQTLRRATS